jgi:hypothetical protein
MAVGAVEQSECWMSQLLAGTSTAWQRTCTPQDLKDYKKLGNAAVTSLKQKTKQAMELCRTAQRRLHLLQQGHNSINHPDLF